MAQVRSWKTQFILLGHGQRCTSTVVHWRETKSRALKAANASPKTSPVLSASKLDYERWPSAKLRAQIDPIRHFYFPRLEKANKRSVQDEGVTIDKAIQSLLGKVSSVDPTEEIKLVAKCDLVGENANGIRGVLALKTSLASNPSILALAPPDQWEKAKAAGATIVGSADLVEPIMEGKLSFDRCIATVDQMPILAKLARYLGPRGLMPNAKTGTLTNDLDRAIRDALFNSPYRIEKDSRMLEFPFARASFSKTEIESNLKIVMDYLQSQNKTTNTGRFVEEASLQMGDLRVNLSKDQYGPSKGPKFLLALEKLRSQIAARNSKRSQGASPNH